MCVAASSHGDNLSSNQLHALALRLGQPQKLLDCHQRRGRAHNLILLLHSAAAAFGCHQLFDLYQRGWIVARVAGVAVLVVVVGDGAAQGIQGKIGQ